MAERTLALPRGIPAELRAHGVWPLLRELRSVVVPEAELHAREALAEAVEQLRQGDGAAFETPMAVYIIHPR